MQISYVNSANDDFVKLCTLLDDSLNETSGGINREYYKQFNSVMQIHDIFLAYDDEVPIGCASFKYFEDGIAEVKRVYVKPEYRGQGISKLLMKKLEEKAKELGYLKLILETGAKFQAAIGLYKSIGFQVIDNYGQYKDIKESICMEKYIVNNY